MTTPVRNSLKAQSLLAPHVKDGLGAVRQAHKQLIDKQVRSHFTDSLDIDERLRDSHEQENRWDYLLGHEASSLVVGFEPHSAYTGEVSTVIAKKNAAREQLRVHLRSGASIAACFWVASGKVDFAPHDKVMRRLEQAGISFVGGMLRAKDLSKLQPPKTSR